MGSVLHRMKSDGDLVAGHDGFGFPAPLRQQAHRAEFDCPLLGLSARIGYHDEHPAMRVGPLELLDGTFQRDLLVRGELGIGMMRESWDCGSRQRKRDSADDKRPHIHRSPRSGLSSLILTDWLLVPNCAPARPELAREAASPIVEQQKGSEFMGAKRPF